MTTKPIYLLSDATGETAEKMVMAALTQFREKPGVVDVRVKGAVAAIQMKHIDDPAKMREEFVREGVWIRPFGDVIYVTPSFSIESAEISALTEAIDNVLNRFSKTYV